MECIIKYSRLPLIDQAGSAAKKRAQDNEKIMNNITYYFFGTTVWGFTISLPGLFMI